MSRAPTIEVSEVRLSTAHTRDRATGLVGWLSIVINHSIRIDGLTLRRSRQGKLYIGYPARTDARGGQRYLLHPITDHARHEVQRQVLEAIAAELAP